jgi:hypothetical protein
MLGMWLGSQVLGAGGSGTLLDVDLYGKTYEKGSVDTAPSGMGGLDSLLGMGIGGVALLLMFMSMNSRQQQPLVVVVDDE